MLHSKCHSVCAACFYCWTNGSRQLKQQNEWLSLACLCFIPKRRTANGAQKSSSSGKWQAQRALGLALLLAMLLALGPATQPAAQLCVEFWFSSMHEFFFFFLLFICFHIQSFIMQRSDPWKI